MRRSTQSVVAYTCLLLACGAGTIANAADTSVGTKAKADAETSASAPSLAVCADPANLPYADDRTPGFENRIAGVLAADLHTNVRTTWYRSYRSFLRGTLLSGACDVIISVPSVLPGIATTKPYFASSYVAVTRAGATNHFASFDDSWLKDAHIGVQLVGADDSQTPPVEALAMRGITGHITGFPMRSAQNIDNPQGRIIDAVASGAIDVAFVWGPTAGYFAKPFGSKLRLDPLTTDPKNAYITFTYAIAMGVRAADTALRDRLQGAIDRHGAEISTILSEYGIPTVPIPEQPAPHEANHPGQAAPSALAGK